MVPKLMKNYYEILEVNQKASIEIIEKAYKVLAKKYHPDLYTGEKRVYAEKKLKAINEAYHVLSDEFLREQYDNEIYNQNRIPSQGEVKPKVRTKSEYQPKNRKEKAPLEEQKEKYKVGTMGSMIELTKGLIHDISKNKGKRRRIKDMNSQDALAIVLTVLVVIVIGIILWFLPFTNSWMRELLFENPIFNWIGRFFS